MKILRKGAATTTTTRQVGKCELFAGERNKKYLFIFLNIFLWQKLFFYFKILHFSSNLENCSNFEH